MQAQHLIQRALHRSSVADTLTGILTSADRIGRAEAALHLAKQEPQYQPEASLVQQCIRNAFMNLVSFKGTSHPQYQGESKGHDVMLQLLNKALLPESWTLGVDSAWFVGELDGYHYTAYFKTGGHGGKMGCVRIAIHEIAHSCLDCT